MFSKIPIDVIKIDFQPLALIKLRTLSKVYRDSLTVDFIMSRITDDDIMSACKTNDIPLLEFYFANLKIDERYFKVNYWMKMSYCYMYFDAFMFLLQKLLRHYINLGHIYIDDIENAKFESFMEELYRYCTDILCILNDVLIHKYPIAEQVQNLCKAAGISVSI